MKLFIRKRTTKQSWLNWLMFHVHLWFGLLTASVVFVLCMTGASVVFRPQLVDLSNYSKAYHSGTTVQTCSIAKVIADYENTFGEKPARVEIPESNRKNIKAYTSGRYPTITYFDRASGQMLGETSGTYAKIMTFMMNGHRRFFMGNNSTTGGLIISWGNVIFMLLLITGIILWFPKSIRQAKARFKILIPRNFQASNYLTHVNWGFYTTWGLLVIVITGVFFSFRNIQNSTVNLFRTDTELAQMANPEMIASDIEARMDALYQAALENPQAKTALPQPDYDHLVEAANRKLDYTGNLEITVPKPGDELITIKKANTHNLLGAVLTDQAFLSRDAEVRATVLFRDLSLSTKVNSFIRPLHTGEILGFKSQLLYFILCLLGAWFPISGVIMWWSRISAKKRRKSKNENEPITVSAL